MEQRDFVTVSKPPLELFKSKSSELQEHFERPVQGNFFEKTEYPEEGGIFVHYYDHPFPAKGQPFPEAVESINSPKKFLKAIAYFLKSHPSVGILLLLPRCITKRYIKSFLDNFLLHFAYEMIEPYLFEEKRWCKSAREVRRAGKIAIEKVGSIWMKYYLMGLDIVVSVIEWDNAYRYRTQDIFGVLNKNNFKKNPAKEIARLTQIQVQRERGWFENKGKFIVFGNVLRFLMFFVPELKKTLVQFIDEVNIDEVKMDEADNYYNLLRADYDTAGEPMEMRQKKYIKIITEYQKKHPERIQRGRESFDQTGVISGLRKQVIDMQGIPLLLFFATRDSDGQKEGGNVKVRLLETKVSLDNPQLKEVCKKVLNTPKEDAKKP